MFRWLFGKKGIDDVEEETKKGFDSVKKDIVSVSGWIKHLDSEKNIQKKEIDDLKTELSSMKEELEGVKNIISIMGGLKLNNKIGVSKQLTNKQMPVYAVETAVQTAVETPNLGQFSTTERAIIWVLLNTDMKLSYDDLSAMLGKERSTIRSQVNIIKQKSDSLIEEVIEKNGKKRIYIPDLMKEKMLKKTKVRMGKVKRQKSEESD